LSRMIRVFLLGSDARSDFLVYCFRIYYADERSKENSYNGIDFRGLGFNLIEWVAPIAAIGVERQEDNLLRLAALRRGELQVI